MVVLRGIEPSAVSHELCPISAIFPACPGLLWGELEGILSYLTLSELRCGLAASGRAGCLAYEKQKNYRVGEKRSKASFTARAEWRTSLSGGMGLLVSYPRSGNTLMRSLLEAATGRITGSDSRPNRNLAAELLRCGFLGEGVCDPSVWLVKSHYPERPGYRRFRAQRVVLLVRNPFDSILSYLHMGLTNTHDRTLSAASLALPEVRDLWADFAVSEAAVWRRFHEFWLQMARVVPVLVLRFEDVAADPAAATATAVQFLRQTCRSAHAATAAATAAADAESRPGYRSKVAGKRAGAALRYMPPAMLLAMLHELGPTLGAFGYSVAVPVGFGAAADADAPAPTDSCTAQIALQPLPPESLLHLAPAPAQAQAHVIVNDGAVHEYTARVPGDRYGRGITKIRHELTGGDSRPLEADSRVSTERTLLY